MAYRKIPAQPGSSSRDKFVSVSRGLVARRYGNTRTYRGTCTGGSWMTVLLGPDALAGQIGGSSTDGSGLGSVITPLREYSPNKNWVAGHLLSASLGGSGIHDCNLTALTTAANNAHKTFEQHVEKMLAWCNLMDRNIRDADAWYGVEYSVSVSPLTYAKSPTPDDMYSYVYSHLTLNYGFVKLLKFPAGSRPSDKQHPPNKGEPLRSTDANWPALLNFMDACPWPTPQNPNNVKNLTVSALTNGGRTLSVEIHNQL